MNKTLVISAHPPVESAIADALKGRAIGEVIQRQTVEDAEPFLSRESDVRPAGAMLIASNDDQKPAKSESVHTYTI